MIGNKLYFNKFSAKPLPQPWTGNQPSSEDRRYFLVGRPALAEIPGRDLLDEDPQLNVIRSIDAQLAPYAFDLLRVGNFSGKQIRGVAAKPRKQKKNQQDHPEQGRDDLPEAADDVGEHDGSLIASLSGDFFEKSLGRGSAAEKLPHHFGGRPLPAFREDELAEAPTGGGNHKVLPIHRQHVERQNLRPHVAVVAGAVSADEVAERAGKLRVGNVACRRFAFHPDPSLHRIDLALAEKRHIVRGVQMLPRVLDAPAE